MPTRRDRAEVPVYLDDLLPQLQQTLATVAERAGSQDIDTERS